MDKRWSRGPVAVGDYRGVIKTSPGPVRRDGTDYQSIKRNIRVVPTGPRPGAFLSTVSKVEFGTNPPLIQRTSISHRNLWDLRKSLGFQEGRLKRPSGFLFRLLFVKDLFFKGGIDFRFPETMRYSN